MGKQSAHNAAGQMAGYMFQPERVLSHLGRSKDGAIVGVETLDDVAHLLGDGRKILEQDKHYASDQKPLADRSKELWNSLSIWLDAIDAGDADFESTRFHLVTNKVLTNGLAFRLKAVNKSKKQLSSFVKELRLAGQNPPKDIKDIVNAVLRRSNAELKNLISCIDVFDGNASVHGDALKAELRAHMHMPVAHAEEILQGLLGWIDEQVLSKIRDRKPAWIARTAFTERYVRLLYRYQDIAFIRETERALIQVSEEDRAKQSGQIFVKQLQWVGCSDSDEDNQILEAIDAHICSGTEVARLSKKGVVDLQEFRAFDDRLLTRWKNLRRLFIPSKLPANDEEQKNIGRKLLNETLNHREPLAGQQTSEYYLTQGAYHRLADRPVKLGWHPLFNKKINALEGI